MVDRQKVETILQRRFPGAAVPQVAAAANAIMGLDEEWEEVGDHVSPGFHGAPCSDVCYIAGELDPCAEFRVFRRRVV